MNRICFHIFALLALLIPASQSRADEPVELSRREKGDLAIQARGILKKYCSECHSGEASQRGTILVLDHTKLVAAGPNKVPFVFPRNPNASQIVQFIEDGSMPPGFRPRPTDDEIATLKKWIAESAPSYPKAFDNRNTLKVMLDDMDRQPAESIRYLRYLSLAHLVGKMALRRILARRKTISGSPSNGATRNCVLLPSPSMTPLPCFALTSAPWAGKAVNYSFVP